MTSHHLRVLLEPRCEGDIYDGLPADVVAQTVVAMIELNETILVDEDRTRLLFDVALIAT